MVRTPGNPDVQPQFQYDPSGIAVAEKHVDIVAQKQCQALNIMLQTDYARGEECALRALEQASIDSRYRIVRDMNYSVLPARFSTGVRHFLAENPFGTLIWDSLRTTGEHTYVARLRNRLQSPHLRMFQGMFQAAVLNIPDRNHIADFLRRELTEAGCRSEVAKYVEELASEGIVKWNDDDGKLPEIVCSHLFDQSEGARSRLADSNDLFLRFLAK